ncbi:hypothetical protein OHB01_38545 [Microbispora hainanensis]|uniref:Uncharacterized protein n=1 Tax=Microbispora hainanensis TaxID=568844 RepID=A0ABZ1SZG8_9ACTN|nr:MULTISPECIES: hypothetical protein [Microbispora]NJP23510.1 hypothetical protein [Microbispora sp. CL1-1]TQS15744.1 hypothetical protein FLW53_04685 [Microbispora sp. SCL1-1]
MTFTAMNPTTMATTLGYGAQHQISPLQQLGQQIPGMQHQLSPLAMLQQQEEQILPQEHLVSPVTFWTKVARCSVRYGAPAARQMLEGVLYQHQIREQIQQQVQQQVLPPQVLQALQAIQAQAQQLPQVYGQPYAAQAYAQHPGQQALQLGIQPVMPQHLQAAYGQQVPLTMQPLSQVYGQGYGQGYGQLHQQAAQQVPVPAGAAL